MHKIKKTLITPPLAALSILLGVGVVMTGAHAKDVASYALGLPHGSSLAAEIIKKTESVSQVQNDAKVTAELHNHIEKQTFSSMVKSISDDTNRNSGRGLRNKARKLKQKQPYREPETKSVPHLFQRALGLA